MGPPASKHLRVLPVLAAVVVALVFALACGGGCMPTETPGVSNVHTVVAGVLIRGGQPNEQGLRTLRDSHGVTSVVNFNHLTTEAEAKDAARVGLYYLPLHDNPFDDADNEQLVLQFLKFLRERGRYGGGAVYVHCKTGQDRTGIAIAAWRILECNWTADQALAELRTHQNLPHAAFFQNIPPYVRGIERNRAHWLAKLDSAPDPPVQRPPATRRAAPAGG